MRKIFISIAAAILVAVSCCGPKDGEYTFRLLTTNDVHGRYFPTDYRTDSPVPSLMSLSWYIDSVRVAAGEENVILVEAGDFLHGDNAAYYYNYIDTVSAHVYGRLADAIGYDAVVPGNHDVETGHPVYDRLVRSMDTPLLAANALRNDDGRPYFQEYVTLKRHGLKIVIIGFTNPNNRNSLSAELWDGMDFQSMMPDFAQGVVDRVRMEERPDIVIVAVHSGAGKGDGSIFEQQGLDLYNSLRGVDFLVCSHDHSALTMQNDSIAMVNTGNYCRNLGYGTITVTVKYGKVVSKEMTADLIPVDKNKVDVELVEMFRQDYEKVKNFSTREIGTLKEDLRAIDALTGMSFYVNLLHTLTLNCEPAEISFAAPLTMATLKAGRLVYSDLQTLYPYENQVAVVRMTGAQVKRYLEYSYEGWINRTTKSLSDLDSAAGLVYEVDADKPFGERVSIRSMADGSPFDMERTYNVGMTSYRARGGGDMLRKAGVDVGNIDEHTVAWHTDLRSLMEEYIASVVELDPAVVGDRAIIGEWRFR